MPVVEMKQKFDAINQHLSQASKIPPFISELINELGEINLISILRYFETNYGTNDRIIVSPFYNGINIFARSDITICEFTITFPDLPEGIPFQIIDSYSGILNNHYSIIISDKVKTIFELLENRNFVDVIFMYERPYRFQVLEFILDNYKIDNEQLHELVLSVYKDQEFIYNNRLGWNRIFKSLPKKRKTKLGTLEIYRGIHSSTIEDHVGFSWTTNISIAEWFSRRFHDDLKTPFILKAEINESDILFEIDDRQEEEIIVLPDNLRSIKLLT